MSKVAKENLAQMAFDYVVERIISGQFHPSMRLTERDIALRLDISRVPVREALHRLEHESWVFRDDNGAVYVWRFTEKDVLEIFQIREGLEAIAARQAALHITDKQLAALDKQMKILNKHDSEESNALSADTNSKRQYSTADMQFHQLIVAASGNERVKKIFATVVLQSQCFFYIKAAAVALGNNGSKEFSLIDHQQIYAAIRDRDGDLAEKLIRQHLRGGCEAIIKLKQFLGIS